MKVADWKRMDKEELHRIAMKDCPSMYGLEDDKGCYGSSRFSCTICWEKALKEILEE